MGRRRSSSPATPIADRVAARAAAERRDPALFPERPGRRPADLDRRRRLVDRPDPDAVAHDRAGRERDRARRRNAALLAGRHGLRERLPRAQRRGREERLHALLRLPRVAGRRHRRASCRSRSTRTPIRTARRSFEPLGGGSQPGHADAAEAGRRARGAARRGPLRQHVPRMGAGLSDRDRRLGRPVPQRLAGGRRDHVSAGRSTAAIRTWR